MHHICQFKNMLAELLNYTVHAFPVTQIETVSFYRNEHLTAACFWENNAFAPTVYPADSLRGPYGLLCSIYNADEYICSTDAQIEGWDNEGNPFAMHCSLQNILNKYKV